MNYVFFGTPEFASIILRKLIDASLPPTAVVCNPDRPTGRKKTITPPPAKTIAQKHQIAVVQPEKLDENFKYQILGLKPDFAVVAAYNKILPTEVLNLFQKGVLGVHPSLLPKYRGPSPIQETILKGDVESGVTIYLLDEKIDHGPILESRKLKIVNRNVVYPGLQRELAELGGDLLAETLPKFAADKLKPTPQDESQATYTKKFTSNDAYVNPLDLEEAERSGGAPAVGMERRIRALNPEPGVWTLKEGKRVKLLEAELAAGKLKLKKIQIEGGQPKIPDSKF